MSNNQIGEEGARHLGDALASNSSVTTLEWVCRFSSHPSVWSNNLGDIGVQHVCEGLKRNRAVQVLGCPQLPTPLHQAR
jgi:hypothetical protein